MTRITQMRDGLQVFRRMRKLSKRGKMDKILLRLPCNVSLFYKKIPFLTKTPSHEQRSRDYLCATAHDYLRIRADYSAPPAHDYRTTG